MAVNSGEVEELHWSKTRSCVKSLRPQLYICGYVSCTDIRDFRLCEQNGSCPQKIKVFILQRDNEKNWDKLLSLVGPKPKVTSASRMQA